MEPRRAPPHERSLPTLAKAAGELIVRTLESQRERESVQRDLADPKPRAKVVRNWAKTLKDKRGRDIDEPVRGELLLAGESGEQLTSEGQRLPSRRYLAANRLDPRALPGPSARLRSIRTSGGRAIMRRGSSATRRGCS